MSHYVYDTYYIDISIENVFNLLINNTFLSNIKNPQEQTNQSNINLSINPTPIMSSFDNSWRLERTFQQI